MSVNLEGFEILFARMLLLRQYQYVHKDVWKNSMVHITLHVKLLCCT